jgi:hypothetical protein
MIVDCGPPGKGPGKGKGVLSDTPIPTHFNSPGSYQERALIQAGIVWNHWLREATRLFAEYWRSGDLKHFQAFGRHIDAMRTYGGPRR